MSTIIQTKIQSSEEALKKLHADRARLQQALTQNGALIERHTGALHVLKETLLEMASPDAPANGGGDPILPDEPTDGEEAPEKTL